MYSTTTCEFIDGAGFMIFCVELCCNGESCVCLCKVNIIHSIIERHH